MTDDKHITEIDGKTVLSRAEAEQVIRRADPEEVVRLAYTGAAAVLDLEYGEVLARGEMKGMETCGPTEVLLWRVSPEDREHFHWSGWENNRGNALADEEVQEVLLRVREGMRFGGLDAEKYIPETLIDEMVEGYFLRVCEWRAEEYVSFLKNNADGLDRMPEADDFLRVAWEGLDRVYGTAPNGEEAMEEAPETWDKA